MMADFDNSGSSDCCNFGSFGDLTTIGTAEDEAFKNKNGSSSFSWFKRVLKFALPVQVIINDTDNNTIGFFKLRSISNKNKTPAE